MSYNIVFMAELADGEEVKVDVGEVRLAYNYYPLLKRLGVREFLVPEANEKRTALIKLYEPILTALVALRNLDDKVAHSLIGGGGSWGTRGNLIRQLDLIVTVARKWPNLYLRVS